MRQKTYMDDIPIYWSSTIFALKFNDVGRDQHAGPVSEIAVRLDKGFRDNAMPRLTVCASVCLIHINILFHHISEPHIQSC